MSNYGILVLITILVTSLVSFFLLYKAKELNLGIVISISIGSIILGFTFSPAFKAILKVLIENINIDKKLAFIISLLIFLLVFLIFILMLSLIISISIPKKIASIDCCVVIDRIKTRIKMKDGIVSEKGKSTGFTSKIGSNLQGIVKNVYNLINKLKKPVDTKQIIDTMGIEKNEIGIVDKKSSNNSETLESMAFANLIAFMEPSKQEEYANQDSFIDEETINQNVKANDSAYENLAAEAYQELVSTQDSSTYADEMEVTEEEITESIIDEIVETETPIDEIDTEEETSEIVIDEIIESETPIYEIDTEEETTDIEIDEIIETEMPINEIDVAAEETNESITEEIVETETPIDENASDAKSLVLKAFENKDAGRKEDAIECYMEALQHEPNSEMMFWIVLDVCALYKQLGLSELARNILEGLVSQYGAVIQPEVKMEIMNYLK